jgi:hypothetical protein
VVPELIWRARMSAGVVPRGIQSMRLDSKSSSGGPIWVAVLARYKWCTEVEMPGVGSTRSRGSAGPGASLFPLPPPGPRRQQRPHFAAAAAAKASLCSALPIGISPPQVPVMNRCRHSSTRRRSGARPGDVQVIRRVLPLEHRHDRRRTADRLGHPQDGGPLAVAAPQRGRVIDDLRERLSTAACPPPVRSIPMSASITVRPRRALRTSHISSGARPHGIVPSRIHRRTDA